MLVLGRKPGETIRIGDDIEVTVLAVSGQRVRLGIAAPNDVTIVRQELVIQREPLPAKLPSTKRRRQALLSAG